jgi:ribosomal protein L19
MYKKNEGVSKYLKFKIRKQLWNFKFDKLLWFTRGDTITFSYKGNSFGYSFTGICLRIRKKLLLDLNSSLLARNIVGQVILESAITLYAIFQLRLWLMEHAKKRTRYRASKLYFLRNKIHQASRVKFC